MNEAHCHCGDTLDAMPVDPEVVYLQLKQLIVEAPLLAPGSVTPDVQLWLGRAALLVEQVNGQISMDPIAVRTAADNLGSPHLPDTPHRIFAILNRALARAELGAPTAARGGFIVKGADFDAFQVLSQVLGEATADVLIVDPYMDAKVFTDFAPLAAEGVTIRLLSDREYTRPELLQPALDRWVAQLGSSRPLQVRQTPRKVLHDRDIVIDEAKVWYMTQSLKDFAKRSHASVGRVDSEQAAMKVDAYARLWAEATPL